MTSLIRVRYAARYCVSSTCSVDTSGKAVKTEHAHVTMPNEMQWWRCCTCGDIMPARYALMDVRGLTFEEIRALESTFVNSEIAL